MNKITENDLRIINQSMAGDEYETDGQCMAMMISRGLALPVADLAMSWRNLYFLDPFFYLQLNAQGNGLLPGPAIVRSCCPAPAITDEILAIVNDTLCNWEHTTDEGMVECWIRNGMPPPIAYIAIHWRPEFFKDTMFELYANETRDQFIAGNVYERLAKIAEDQ